MAATATCVTLTEDDLSCDICADIFRDPHMLRCLHTFCKKCITKLTSHQNVECPYCRHITSSADIRKDFKTQTLVDQHYHKNNSESDKTTPGGLSCDWCRQKGKLIQWYCPDCDLKLCLACSLVHSRVKTMSSHCITNIVEMKNKTQMELETTSSVLQREEKRISVGITAIEATIDKILEAHENNKKQIDESINQVIIQLENRQSELHSEIRESVQTEIKELEKSKGTCIKMREDIRNDINKISDNIAQADLEFPINKNRRGINDINEHIYNDLEKIQKNLPNVSNRNVLPVIVVTGSYDPKKIVWLSKIVENDDSSLKSDRAQLEYSTIKENHYEKSTSVFTRGVVWRIKLINGYLYCACQDQGVKIYDQNCKFVKQITHPRLGDVTGIAQNGSGGDLIVSCSGFLTHAMPYKGMGLHQLTLQGEYVRCLTQGWFSVWGKFSDVCYYNGIIYGLEWEKHKLILFQLKNNNKWVQTGDMRLDYRQTSYFNKLVVHSSGIYVSLREEGSIQVYNHDGVLIEQTHQTNMGPLGHPVVSHVDINDHLLVLDWDKHKVHVYEGQGRWYNLKLNGDLINPSDVIVDEDGGRIWLTTRNSWLTSKEELIIYRNTSL